jgi:hypothetical protein
MNAHAHSTRLGYSQHSGYSPYERTSSIKRRTYRYLYKVSTKARTQKPHECFLCEEHVRPGYLLGKFYVYCCADCVGQLSKDMCDVI